VHILKILLAEDVAMVRGALVALIELEPDLKVVAALERGDEVVPAAQARQPDIAIIDIDLPGLDGLSAAEQLHQHIPSCPILILTNLGRAGTLRRALDAHVGGYLLKDAPAEQLATAIRDVAAGRRVIDPQLAVSTWEGAQNPLSPREHEVLRRAAEGAEPAEIAAAMNLSLGTVRNYLTAIVTKLNARNRVDAIKTAYDSGWLPLSPALCAALCSRGPHRHDRSDARSRSFSARASLSWPYRPNAISASSAHRRSCSASAIATQHSCGSHACSHPILSHLA
jgi:two-component system response regulator DesR